MENHETSPNPSSLTDGAAGNLSEKEGRTDLQLAREDLQVALDELKDAERHVEKAEDEIEAALINQGEEAHRKFELGVVYDGITKNFEVHSEDLVRSLLDRAVAAFGPLQNPHLLGLFKGANELPDANTLKAADVKPHDKLLLRPSQVRGG